LLTLHASGADSYARPNKRLKLAARVD
jgi:hypothetical protein